jgi:nuclear protein localization protein 4 homolog
MVDHVEFESPTLIEDFIGYWRGTGMQRVGILMGRYEGYDGVSESCIFMTNMTLITLNN